MRYYNWKLTFYVEDNYFKPLVEKIMKSEPSCFITGPSWSGKTTLLKQMQDVLTKQDKKYITLCPTNLAALLVGGPRTHRQRARAAALRTAPRASLLTLAPPTDYKTYNVICPYARIKISNLY
jgi:adenylylsulfate kinase-like enzyme